LVYFETARLKFFPVLFLIVKKAKIKRMQARNQLGTPGGAKSFSRGPNFFKLCPIVLNYSMSNTFFQGGILQGRLRPSCAPLVTGLNGSKKISYENKDTEHSFPQF